MPSISTWDSMDLRFYKKPKKNGEAKPVDAPVLEGSVADTHAHIDMLEDPAYALARAGALGVGLICSMTEASDAARETYRDTPMWCADAAAMLEAAGIDAQVPAVRLAAGVHPHDSKKWSPAIEADLRSLLTDSRTAVLGEVGLDYHYDFSPRDVQREVFARQVALAHETGLPLSLHMREAHPDGLAILREQGFPVAGTILHCFNLGPDDLEPWLEEDCFIAIGGPVTFGSFDTLRQAVPMIPDNRLLTETDCPYMTPAPMRGVECEPAHVLFTAAKLAEVRGVASGEQRRLFLAQLRANAASLLEREPTPWQRNA